MPTGGRLYLESDLHTGLDAVTHHRCHFASTGAEMKTGGGMYHVITHPGSTVAQGIVQQGLVVLKSLVERLRCEDMGVHRPKSVLIRQKPLADRTEFVRQGMCIGAADDGHGALL